jgi:hypothetical protein
MKRGALVACAIAACTPTLDDRAALVRAERVLAVRAEPPEAAPGEDVAYSALVATPDGTRGDAAIAWAYCAQPKSIAENEVVSSACLGADATRAIAVSPATHAAMPNDACSLFGPDPPPGDFRPRDPDTTGGYYQPLRTSLDGAYAFALTRIACHLANAPADVAADLGARYQKNQNPHLLAVTVDGAIATRVAPGARVMLRAAWSDADAERYVSFDLASQSIIDRREAMRVAWFASAGTFDSDKTGRTEADLATTSDNGWSAPASGTAHVWIVLRDSRGGVDWASVDLVVAP